MLPPKSPEEKAFVDALRSGQIRPEFINGVVEFMAAQTKNKVTAAIPGGIVAPAGAENVEQQVEGKANVVFADDRKRIVFGELILYKSGKMRFIPNPNNDIRGLSNFAASVPKELLNRALNGPIECPQAIADCIKNNPDGDLGVGTTLSREKNRVNFWGKRENNLKQLLGDF